VPWIQREQFQHAGVIDWPPGQRISDLGREMVVADRDGIRVTAGTLPYLG